MLAARKALPGTRGEIASMLAPADCDLTILQPLHSAFHATPLEYLLREHGAREVIVVGHAEREVCMLELDLPWWQFPLRATLVYVALLVLVRLSGRCTVGQFTPFELLVVMLLSESASNGLAG